jgi:hypothetical protein
LLSRLLTVATFVTPLEAELTRGRLDEGGVEAIVTDAELVTVDWSMSNAIGGVKVRVAAEDAERARAVLSEPVELPDDYEAHTEAESLAQRALYAAMLGSLFLPVQIYTLYLLSRYFAEAADETARTKRLMLGAVLLMIPSLVAAIFLVAM